MNCQALVELITDYLEGALSESEQARFESHLAACSGCQNYLSQIHHTLRLVGSLSEEHLQPEAKAELLAIFKNWVTKP